MRSYTIKNDFHGTEVTIRCEGLSHITGEVEIRPSVGQIKKMQKVLCGISDCQCSGDAGNRGISRTDDGKRIIVDCSALYVRRDDAGRYDFGNDAVCKCGHRFGEHFPSSRACTVGQTDDRPKCSCGKFKAAQSK